MVPKFRELSAGEMLADPIVRALMAPDASPPRRSRLCCARRQKSSEGGPVVTVPRGPEYRTRRS